MAAPLVERVQLIAQAVTTGFSQKIGAVRSSVRGLKKEFQEFTATTFLPIENLREMGDQLQQSTSRGVRAGFAFRNLTTGMRGFRMELLAVLFFGMAVQRMFTGFLKPTAEAFSIFELFRDMLLVTFIPVFEKDLFPAFMKLFNFIIGLDEPTKLLIGRLVVLGAVLGSLAFVFAALFLGIGGIIGLISAGLAPVILSVIGIFAAMVIGITLLVSGFILVFKKKWEGLGLIIMGIGAILAVFIGWWALIPIAVGAAVFFIIRNWNKITDFFQGWIEVFKFWFTTAIDFLKDKFGRVFDVITMPFKEAWEFIKSIVDRIKTKVGSVASAITNPLGIIGKGVGGFFSRINPFNDFIIRPGSPPIPFSPSDTVVGVKNPGALGGKGVTVSPTFNITVTDRIELERMIETRLRDLVNDLRRLTKT